MKVQSIYKVPQGKLLKIFLEKDDKNNTIKKINITGDFFAHPEESIQELESFLKDTSFEKNEIFQKISKFIDIRDIQFIGVNAESITDAIMRCV